MKRLLPILLCLVMLFGLLPTAAFAAESITNTTIHLTLESSTMPWYNAQILSAADMIGKIGVDSPYSDKVSIYSAEWYTDTDAPAGGKFETLKNYYLLLHLSAKSGYNFTDTGTIRVEGRVPTGLTEPAYLESYKSETTTVTSSAGGQALLPLSDQGRLV